MGPEKKNPKSARNESGSGHSRKSPGIRIVLELTPQEVAALDREQKDKGTSRKELIHKAIAEAYIPGLHEKLFGFLFISALLLAIDWGLGHSWWVHHDWFWGSIKAVGFLVFALITLGCFTVIYGELRTGSTEKKLSDSPSLSEMNPSSNPVVQAALPEPALIPLKLPSHHASSAPLLDSGPKPELNTLTINRAQPTGLTVSEDPRALRAPQPVLDESQWEREVFEKLGGLRCPNCDGIDLGVILYGPLPRGDGRLNHLLRMRLFIPHSSPHGEEDLYCNDCENYWVSGKGLAPWARSGVPRQL